MVEDKMGSWKAQEKMVLKERDKLKGEEGWENDCKPAVFSLSSRNKRSSDFHGCDELEERELFLLEILRAGGILHLSQNKTPLFC